MRKFVFGFLTILLSTSAMASESYICSAEAPKGEVSLVVENTLTTGQKITFRFHHYGRNQFHVGHLTISANEGSDFIATGRAVAYEPNPSSDIFLSGSLNPNYNEIQTLQLYASSNGEIDRRIEYGFGNILRCKKQ